MTKTTKYSTPEIRHIPDLVKCATTSKQRNVHFNCSILQGTLLIKIHFTGINWDFIYFCIWGIIWEFTPLLGHAAEWISPPYRWVCVDPSSPPCFHTHILENYAGILLQEPENTEISPGILLCHSAGLHNPCAIQEFQVLWIQEQWNIRIPGALKRMLDGSKWQMWSFACRHWMSSSEVFIHLRTIWNLWCLSKHL